MHQRPTAPTISRSFTTAQGSLFDAESEAYHLILGRIRDIHQERTHIAGFAVSA